MRRQNSSRQHHHHNDDEYEDDDNNNGNIQKALEKDGLVRKINLTNSRSLDTTDMPDTADIPISDRVLRSKL